jgi:uncharacterized OB-fold protein
MVGYCTFCKGQHTNGCTYCNPNRVWYTPDTGMDFKLMGWECPVCGRGNAPARLTCPCFKEKNKNGRQQG